MLGCRLIMEASMLRILIALLLLATSAQAVEYGAPNSQGRTVSP